MPLRRLGVRDRETGVKLKQGGVGEGVLKVGFISHYPALI